MLSEWTKAKRRHPEARLQCAVVDLLRLYQSRGNLMFAHVPNSAPDRTRAEGGILKAMGTTAGVPDLLVWLRGGGHFAIELKAGTRSLSPVQREWHASWVSLGHRVYVCRSVEEVEEVLRLENVPPIGIVTPSTKSPVTKPSQDRTAKTVGATPAKRSTRRWRRRTMTSSPKRETPRA